MVSLFCAPPPPFHFAPALKLRPKEEGKNWGCFDVRSKNSLLALDVGAGRPTGEVKNISGEKVGRSVWEREVCAQLYSGGGLSLAGLTSRKKIGGDGKREGEEEEELPLGPDGRKRVFSFHLLPFPRKKGEKSPGGQSRRFTKGSFPAEIELFLAWPKEEWGNIGALKKFYVGGPF